MYWARNDLMDQVLQGGGMCSTECPSRFYKFQQWFAESWVLLAQSAQCVRYTRPADPHLSAECKRRDQGPLCQEHCVKMWSKSSGNLHHSQNPIGWHPIVISDVNRSLEHDVRVWAYRTLFFAARPVSHWRLLVAESAAPDVWPTIHKCENTPS